MDQRGREYHGQSKRTRAARRTIVRCVRVTMLRVVIGVRMCASVVMRCTSRVIARMRTVRRIEVRAGERRSHTPHRE